MINKLFRNRYFLINLQYFTLFIFIVIIYGAWGISTTDPKFAKVLRNTNLSNLIIWSYWWPIIVTTAILFGRFWCSLCPIELITSFFGKIGLKRKPNKLMKSGWLVTLFYATILVLGINTFTIHRIPQYMAIYMLTLITIAVIIGLVYEKRTFCSHVCPIGHLLGLYSLVSRRKVGVISQATCNECKTKDCISNTNQYKYIGRSCTSGLYPAKMEDSKSCILCGQCFKACPNKNVIYKKQVLGSKLIQNLKLSWAEIAFFMIVSGFVVYEILSNWSVSLEKLQALPVYINNRFNIPAPFSGTIKALILYVVLPITLYFTLALIKIFFAKENLKQALNQLVIAILPIAASMHLLKALLKTTSRLPYWDYALKDPKGIDSAIIIIQHKNVLTNYMALPNFSLIINILSILIPILGLVLSFYVIRKQNFANLLSKVISILAILVYTSIFLSTLIYWRLT